MARQLGAILPLALGLSLSSVDEMRSNCCQIRGICQEKQSQIPWQTIEAPICVKSPH